MLLERIRRARRIHIAHTRQLGAAIDNALHVATPLAAAANLGETERASGRTTPRGLSHTSRRTRPYGEGGGGGGPDKDTTRQRMHGVHSVPFVNYEKRRIKIL
jgi:hypothetical protein